MNTRANLLEFDRPSLQDFFTGIGESAFRARQVMQWVYQRRITEFGRMTDLGKSLRGRLDELAEIRFPVVAAERASRDGTRKWLLSVSGGSAVETVFIPDGRRGTLCVSSQAGCSLNCTFCATARQGFHRNLTTAEIIGQLWVAAERLAERDADAAVTNVVLMGMGEPLLNYDAVVPAMRLMLDDLSFGLSRRRVTLSTAGVAPAIERLARDCPVSLAVSLHAPNDELRTRLVPLNKKFGIAALLNACRRYAAGGRRVTFEYVMLRDVNDREEHAAQLARLLAGTPAKVNLIPFNPAPGLPYARSSAATIDAFRDRLLAAGIMTITRKTRGSDIDAACGQLAGSVRDRTGRARRMGAQAS